MRFLLYSHDGLGLGHTRRNLALATALTQLSSEARVLLATGVDEIHEFGLPENVDTLKLPCLRKISTGSYVGRRLHLSSSEIRGVRSALLQAAVESFRPAVLVVDKHPLGASGELRAGLKTLRQQGGRAVLGLRDVLDDGPTVIREWEQHDLAEHIAELYDLVLIYGHASLFDVRTEYKLPARVIEKSRFCGYVVTPDGASSPPPNLPWTGLESSDPSRPTVLATAGGGEDGFFILESFLRASTRHPWKSIVVAGPMIPPHEAGILERMAKEANVSFHRFLPRLARLFWSLDVLVCMGGYNTLAEAMSKGIPTVCVPRISPRREQFIRAQALAKAGLLQCIHPDDLSVESLQLGIASALQNNRSDLVGKVNATLQLNGAQQAAHHILAIAGGGPAVADRREALIRS